PSTTAETFGLIQEEVYKEPWRLFVAAMLLNVTNGEKAIPKFWELMEKYPTINDLPHANLDELTLLIKPLGLQARRAETMINLARFLITNPPTVGQRFRLLNYPFKGAHRDIRPGEVLSDDDPRAGAYEVSHLPGVGPYAIDSWRIFCRDQLRGKSTGFNGEDAEPGFEPEWKRVRPNDKELKGFIRWMWLREGWIWDPETGEKKRTSEDEALAASL
ncbi:DNA glycosylase, partial [Phyllosticta citrichinensis]